MSELEGINLFLDYVQRIVSYPKCFVSFQRLLFNRVDIETPCVIAETKITT